MFVHFNTANSKLHCVTPQLYFGDLAAGHSKEIPDAAIVHACKEPCHKQAVCYTKNLDPSHPDYLHRERGTDLYLNMIDPPLPLFKHESFTLFFEFVDRQIALRPVIIHCNQGASRAPSLTLLYMAKRLGLLPNTDYQAARREFENRFPYSPSRGIELFLSENWELLG